MPVGSVDISSDNVLDGVTEDDFQDSAEESQEVASETPEDSGVDFSGPPADIESEFDSQVAAAQAAEDAEGEIEVEAQAEEPEAEAEVAPKGSKAQERIRKLVSERNEIAERFEQREAAFARHIQEIQARADQQYAAHITKLEEQNRLLMERLDSQRSREDREEFEKLPLKDQIERRAADRAKGEIERIVAERVGKLESLYAEERKAREQAEAAAQKRARIGELSRQATEARSVLFKGMNETDLGEAAELVNDMFLGYAGGRGVYPKEAAPQFRKALEKYAQAYMKSVSQSNKKQVDKSRSVPSTSVAKKSGVMGKSVKTPAPRANFQNGKTDPDSLFDDLIQQALS